VRTSNPAKLKMYVGNEKREFARRKGGSGAMNVKSTWSSYFCTKFIIRKNKRENASIPSTP
jgi:hypothetical protein